MRKAENLLLVLTIASLGLACGAEPPGEAPSDPPVAADPAAAEPAAVRAGLRDGVQTARVAVTDMGYQPGRLTLEAGVPARLIFSQESRYECGAQVKSPELGIPLTDLPYGEETTVEFTPTEAGEYSFVCGMDMMRGAIVVTAG